MADRANRRPTHDRRGVDWLEGAVRVAGRRADVVNTEQRGEDAAHPNPATSHCTALTRCKIRHGGLSPSDKMLTPLGMEIERPVRPGSH
jgi:hypothetical protein